MTKTKHDILRGASEIVRYDSAGIPLFIKTAALSEYPGMRALCHWHDDLEFIRIRKGEMYYRVGSQTILLREGDCLLGESGLSVTDTATACGFGHLSYFSKLFRECFGCTPKEYRKRSQSPTD